MDPNLESKLVQLSHLHARGLIDAEELKEARKQALKTADRDASDRTRAADGLPVFGPTGLSSTHGGPVFPGAVVHLGSTAGATPPPQLQLAPPPKQRMALLPAAAGPSPQQVQAEAQLAALQVQQQQMQSQMEAQMAEARTSLNAAAATPAPAAPAAYASAPAPAVSAAAVPQVNAKSNSSGEKLQLQPKPKRPSEKQSTDLDSKGKPLSSQTTRRAIVVMFCDICDSTAMSEALDAEDVREVVLVYQKFVGEVLMSLNGHIAQYLGDGILTYFGFVSSASPCSPPCCPPC